MKQTSTKELIKIITASSVGTLIEWYDFFVFGSLSVIISTQFFPITSIGLCLFGKYALAREYDG